MTDRIKEFFKEHAIIIVPLLIVIIFCTYDDGTDYSQGDLWQAEEEARQEGYNEGYEEGYDKGYEEGHDDGYYAGYHDQ